jgi:hypothetical protein
MKTNIPNAKRSVASVSRLFIRSTVAAFTVNVEQFRTTK